jgi:hypothetical protein
MTSTVVLKGGNNDGIIYMFPRRLFCRRWQPKLSKLSQHFFLDLVQELPATPHKEDSELRDKRRPHLETHTCLRENKNHVHGS